MQLVEIIELMDDQWIVGGVRGLLCSQICCLLWNVLLMLFIWLWWIEILLASQVVICHWHSLVTTRTDQEIFCPLASRSTSFIGFIVSQRKADRWMFLTSWTRYFVRRNKYWKFALLKMTQTSPFGTLSQLTSPRPNLQVLLAFLNEYGFLSSKVWNDLHLTISKRELRCQQKNVPLFGYIF